MLWFQHWALATAIFNIWFCNLADYNNGRPEPLWMAQTFFRLNNFIFLPKSCTTFWGVFNWGHSTSEVLSIWGSQKELPAVRLYVCGSLRAYSLPQSAPFMCQACMGCTSYSAKPPPFYRTTLSCKCVICTSCIHNSHPSLFQKVCHL